MKELIIKTETIIDIVNKLQITTQKEFEFAAESLRKLKISIKAVKAFFKPTIESANKAHKNALEMQKQHLEPRKEAEDIIKNKLSDYATKQKNMRIAEERRLQKLADDQAKKEAEAREKAAQKLRESQKEDEIEPEYEEIIEPEIVPVVPQIKLANPTKIKGTTFVDTWEYEVVDFKALPDEYKIENSKKISQVVRALKKDTAIVGVKITCKKSVKQRT